MTLKNKKELYKPITAWAFYRVYIGWYIQTDHTAIQDQVTCTDQATDNRIMYGCGSLDNIVILIVEQSLHDMYTMLLYRYNMEVIQVNNIHV